MSPNKPLPASLKFRQANAEDLKIVRHSWFESYRRGGKAPSVRFDCYDQGQNYIIKQCLAKSSVLIAYPVEVPDEVCGYSVRQNDLLHYVYVKHAYRRLGIATQLAEGSKVYTHETIPGVKLANKLHLQYNPYWLYAVVTK